MEKHTIIEASKWRLYSSHKTYGIQVPASQEELATWTKEQQKEYGRNKQRDAKALLSILQGVSKEIFQRIMNASSA